MKIEVGKFYKTRCGYKARIYAIDLPGDYPVHGACYEEDACYPYSWTLDGMYNACCKELPLDIVGEWEKPPLELWVNVYTDDGVTGGIVYGTKDVAEYKLRFGGRTVRMREVRE